MLLITFFSSVHFARGNLNSGLVLLITKPLEFGAKLMAHFIAYKPTTVAFGNRMVGHSRTAYLSFWFNYPSVSYLDSSKVIRRILFI